MPEPERRDAFALLMAGSHKRRTAQQASPSSKRPTNSRSSTDADKRADLHITSCETARTVEAVTSAPPEESEAAAQRRAASHTAAAAAFAGIFTRPAAKPPTTAAQPHDVLLVYDLEATCNADRSLQPVEIIELACVLLHVRERRLGASFQARGL